MVPYGDTPPPLSLFGSSLSPTEKYQTAWLKQDDSGYNRDSNFSDIRMGFQEGTNPLKMENEVGKLKGMAMVGLEVLFVRSSRWF